MRNYFKFAICSQAILLNKTLYISGCIGLNPENNKLVSGGIEAETVQIMKNVGHILAEGGSSFDKVVKVNLYLTNLEDFTIVNNIYKEHFKNDPPARSCVGCSRLPLNANVEIDFIAAAGDVEFKNVKCSALKWYVYVRIFESI